MSEMMAVILGALISGLLVGAIPAIAGGVKGKLGLGFGGLGACVLGSLVLGLFLSIPLCALFMFLIFRKSNKNAQGAGYNYGCPPANGNYGYPPPPAPVAPPAMPLADDIPAQIQKLAELKNSGVLTEAEFEEKKAQLLAKMQ